MQQEIEIFEKHVAAKGLKRSKKRDFVLQTFLRTEDHVSADDLCCLVKEKHPDIGYTTVYRALKLIVSSGVAEKVDFDDGVKRFERKVGREYHAHFICTGCGTHFEMFDESIKALSFKLSAASGFRPEKHRFEIFGLCVNCA